MSNIEYLIKDMLEYELDTIIIEDGCIEKEVSGYITNVDSIIFSFVDGSKKLTLYSEDIQATTIEYKCLTISIGEE